MRRWLGTRHSFYCIKFAVVIVPNHLFRRPSFTSGRPGPALAAPPSSQPGAGTAAQISVSGAAWLAGCTCRSSETVMGLLTRQDDETEPASHLHCCNPPGCGCGKTFPGSVLLAPLSLSSCEAYLAADSSRNH